GRPVRDGDRGGPARAGERKRGPVPVARVRADGRKPAILDLVPGRLPPALVVVRGGGPDVPAGVCRADAGPCRNARVRSGLGDGPDLGPGRGLLRPAPIVLLTTPRRRLDGRQDDPPKPPLPD